MKPVISIFCCFLFFPNLISQSKEVSNIRLLIGTAYNPDISKNRLFTAIHMVPNSLPLLVGFQNEFSYKEKKHNLPSIGNYNEKVIYNSTNFIAAAVLARKSFINYSMGCKYSILNITTRYSNMDANVRPYVSENSKLYREFPSMYYQIDIRFHEKLSAMFNLSRINYGNTKNFNLGFAIAWNIYKKEKY